MCFMLIYFVFASAIDVHIFQTYRINYLFVLDIDPNNKLSHFYLYKVSITLFFLFTITLAFTLFEIRF